MTPDELLRERKRRELLARANGAGNTTPSADEALVTDHTKQSFKAAGHWAGVLGKRAAEATKKGAVIAAEKTKAVAAAVSERAKQSRQEALAKRSAGEEPACDPSNESVVEAMGSTAEAPPTGVEPVTTPLAGMTPAEASHTVHQFADPTRDEAADTALASIEPTDPNHAPLPEDPMGELPPLPDDAYSEETTEQQSTDNPARPRRGLLLALLGAGLVGTGLAAFAWLGRDDATEASIPVTLPITEAPIPLKNVTPLPAPAEPVAKPMPAPVEPVPMQPETNPVDAIEAGLLPEPEQALPPSASRTPVEAKAPALERPRAAASPERRPATRSSPRAPAPAPVNALQWQRQADADLDAWAKRAGLD